MTAQSDLFTAVQEEALKVHRPLVLVGTPGRLAELSRAGALLTHHTGASLHQLSYWMSASCIRCLRSIIAGAPWIALEIRQSASTHCACASIGQQQSSEQGCTVLPQVLQHGSGQNSR